MAESRRSQVYRITIYLTYGNSARRRRTHANPSTKPWRNFVVSSAGISAGQRECGQRGGCASAATPTAAGDRRRTERYLSLHCLRGRSAGAQHNSVVELVDRCEKEGLVERGMDPKDRRRVCLRTTPKGQRALDQLSQVHLLELNWRAPQLITALEKVLQTEGPKGPRLSRKRVD